jgi:hypothetical protein
VDGTDSNGLHDCGWTDPLGCIGNAGDAARHAVAAAYDSANQWTLSRTCSSGLLRPGSPAYEFVGCGQQNSSKYVASPACSNPSSQGVAASGVNLNFDDPSQPPGPGWEWRGTGPTGSGQGAWYNPSTDQSLRPDLEHLPPIDPHYDYKGPDTGDNSIRLFPGDAVPDIQPLLHLPQIEDLPIEGF